MFKQQIVGVLILSFPVIILFQLFPALIIHPFGPLLVALLMGVYIWYLNYKQHKAVINSLVYTPTGSHKEMFEEMIRTCNMVPETINIRYAYTAEQIAMAMGSTVIVDPVLCSLCDEDSGSLVVRNFFRDHIEPKLTDVAKQRGAEYKLELTPQVQCFVFKHELGHVADNYAAKKLALIFLIGAVSAYAGIVTAKTLLFVNGLLAAILGMVVFGILDLVCTYASNFFFKLPAEKRADYFAAKYTSAQDLKVVADFWKKHQEISIKYAEPANFLAKLPSVLRSGHPEGKDRSAYLLKLAEQK